MGADRHAQAAEAEARYRRMGALHAMDATALRRRLASDAPDVLEWLTAAAHYGLAEAQLRLGQMRLDGVGGPADGCAARRWFVRAADQGLAEAANMVGRCHENGWGGAIDLDLAAQWYRRAAEAGSAWGQYNYAHMLFDGRGVRCDPPGAVLWYERAARQGHDRAMNLLARCFEEGWGVARDLGQARAWYRRSAEGGYFRAQFNVATLLLAEGDLDQACGWFEAALLGAAEPSRAGMAKALAASPHPRLQALARQTEAPP